ncbi:hypothetical protein HY745_04480 [Candidatus Desantisbacteria bacterium]|nr:hypothetical protein [Candidatus Desantisbacteria bacterium]
MPSIFNWIKGNGDFFCSSLEDYDSWNLAVSFGNQLYIDNTPISIKNAQNVTGIKIIVKKSKNPPNIYGTLIDKNKKLMTKSNPIMVESINNYAFFISTRTDKNRNYSMYGLPTDKYKISIYVLDTTTGRQQDIDYETLMIYETGQIKKDIIYTGTEKGRTKYWRETY